MSRRQWTHRRLGIGATQLNDQLLAETDAMLTSIGARRTGATASSVGNDPFETALLDFARDIDLVVGVAALDATPVAAELLRANRPRLRKRRLSWQVLVPATSGGLAVLAVGVTLLLSGSTPTAPTSGLSAAAESKQLLSHADSLLSVAATAAPAERTTLVREAKADLKHVTKLLPLAPPQARPEIRRRLNTLGNRMPAAAPTPAEGATDPTPTGAVASPPPRRIHQLQQQRPAEGVEDTSTPQSSSAADTEDDGRGQPAESGPIPPPRRGPGAVPPPQGGGLGPRPSSPGTAQCSSGAQTQGC